MAKFKALKKIAALVTAIALVVCFAVSASAANVTTETSYANGQEAKVDVTVTEAGANNNVTYYATKDSAVVHIDQAKANASGTATFSFRTDLANLNSTVKVGVTNASTATDAEINGRTLTVIVGDDEQTKVIPTAACTLSFSVPAGEKVTAVTGAAAYEQFGSVLSLQIAKGTADVTVNVTTEETSAEATTDIISARAYTATADDVDLVEDGSEEDNKAANIDAAGDRKLTVVGRVVGTPTNYGIIVNTTAITDATTTDISSLGDVYEAKTKALDGLFAVQLIDTAPAAEADFIVAGTDYYVAIYSFDGTNYTVKALAEAVKAN